MHNEIMHYQFGFSRDRQLLGRNNCEYCESTTKPSTRNAMVQIQKNPERYEYGMKAAQKIKTIGPLVFDLFFFTGKNI